MMTGPTISFALLAGLLASLAVGAAPGTSATTATSATPTETISAPATGDSRAGASDENARLLSIDPSVPEGGNKSSKLAGQLTRLNMSQVAQHEQFFNETEMVAAWDELSSKLESGISGVIKAAVPMTFNMTEEVKIGSECEGAILKWLKSMKQLNVWAWRMLYASGNPLAGLLEGSRTISGNYNQCLNIRAPGDIPLPYEINSAGPSLEYFRGKYCSIQVKHSMSLQERFFAKLGLGLGLPTREKTVFDELLLASDFVNIRLDLCVPSLCSREDLQKAINYMLRGLSLKTQVARCEMDVVQVE